MGRFVVVGVCTRAISRALPPLLAAADPAMARQDMRKYQRHSEVAELVLGEDANALGARIC